MPYSSRYSTILAYLQAVHSHACRERDHSHAGRLASLKHRFQTIDVELTRNERLARVTQ